MKVRGAFRRNRSAVIATNNAPFRAISVSHMLLLCAVENLYALLSALMRAVDSTIC